MIATLQDRVGQLFVDESDVVLIVGLGVYPSDPDALAWTLISLENGQLYILSEDWVNMQDMLGKRVWG